MRNDSTMLIGAGCVKISILNIILSIESRNLRFDEKNCLKFVENNCLRQWIIFMHDDLCRLYLRVS